MVAFDDDVTILNRVHRFRKIDGSPATIKSLQVNPLILVLNLPR